MKPRYFSCKCTCFCGDESRSRISVTRCAVECHVSRQLGQAVGLCRMNGSEWLEKRTRAHLDLLQWSQLPGHHCLKSVLRIEVSGCLCAHLCVCECVFVLHAFASCTYESVLFEAKKKKKTRAGNDSMMPGLCFPSMAVTLDPNMSGIWIRLLRCWTELTGKTLASVGRWQLEENRRWKEREKKKKLDVLSLAAVHVVFLDEWVHAAVTLFKALGVYLWNLECVVLRFCLCSKRWRFNRSTSSNNSTDVLLLRLSLQPLFIVSPTWQGSALSL